MGHARALLGLEDLGLQDRALRTILRKQLSVRETEALVRRLKSSLRKAGQDPEPDAEVADIASRLKRTFQTQVRILPKERKR